MPRKLTTNENPFGTVISDDGGPWWSSSVWTNSYVMVMLMTSMRSWLWNNNDAQFDVICVSNKLPKQSATATKDKHDPRGTALWSVRINDIRKNMKMSLIGQICSWAQWIVHYLRGQWEVVVMKKELWHGRALQ